VRRVALTTISSSLPLFGGGLAAGGEVWACADVANPVAAVAPKAAISMRASPRCLVWFTFFSSRIEQQAQGVFRRPRFQPSLQARKFHRAAEKSQPRLL
jgi:hypothetical protein